METKKRKKSEDVIEVTLTSDEFIKIAAKVAARLAGKMDLSGHEEMCFMIETGAFTAEMAQELFTEKK